MTAQSPFIRNSISRSPLRSGFRLVPLALALAWLAFSPTAQAMFPPPDGGYPNENTAEGEDALFSLTTGGDNTALGFEALFSNATGDYNTAAGAQALQNNETGSANTANGAQTLHSNTTGDGNTASGSNALELNTTGSSNTANGASALFSNETGGSNTANGVSALYWNTTGSGNTANGVNALNNNASGFVNTATGTFALYSNTTGSGNAANGTSALLNNTTGNSNIGFGTGAGQNLTTGSHNIDIGNQGIAAESNTIRIGTQGTQTATFIAGISGTAIGGGVAVRVNANGQLGTVGSSARFKQNIKSMDKASEAIHALKPVTFRYKEELDPEGIPQFGLVAEQVEKVNPALVVRDKEGKPYTVRYDAVNAMLVHEFLQEHRKVEEQEKQIEKLTAALKEQGAQIRNVNDKVEMSRPAAQMVDN